MQYFSKALVCSLLLSSLATLAIPEASYEQMYREAVLPYYETGIINSIEGKKKVRLAYRAFNQNNTRPALIILPGRGEPIAKYAELVYDLKDLDYTIYLFEHRGQGESSLIDDCKIQYVRHYKDYVSDLNRFVRTIVKPWSHPKHYLLAHSMGAAIGTIYAAHHPEFFDAIAFSAPMFDMNTQKHSKRSARALGTIMTGIGQGKKLAATDGNQLTTSQVRAEMNKTILSSSLIDASKISYRWALEALRAIKHVKYLASKVPASVLMLQAGKDLHVPALGQDKLCSKFLSCQKLIYPEAYHEILMEADTVRDEALRQIKEFFQRS